MIQCINMCVMLGFPELIVRIYTSDPAVIAMAASLLFYAAIFQLPDGLQICSASALRGLKDTRVPMLFNLLAYWVIGISLGYYLTFVRELGPAGMWLGMIAGLTAGASLMRLRFIRLTAGRPAPARAPAG